MRTLKRPLILGKKRPKKAGEQFGGVIRAFELFEQELLSLGQNPLVVDTNVGNYSHRLFGYFAILFRFLFALPKSSSVSLHGTASEYFFLAPFVVACCKISGKPVSLRKFAGNFDELVCRASWGKKKLVFYAMANATHLFFETHSLVSYFGFANVNTHWFPNVRRRGARLCEGSYDRKLVFFGHICRAKGVGLIVDAIVDCTPAYSVDFYGPIVDDRLLQEILVTDGLRYCGIVEPSAVQSKMAEYNILLLPTQHSGEGYPGVIVEAFSVGVPVISTHWGGIPEMVLHGDNGLLMGKIDASSLIAEILSIDATLYKKMREGAIRDFSKYEARTVIEEAVRFMHPIE